MPNTTMYAAVEANPVSISDAFDARLNTRNYSTDFVSVGNDVPIKGVICIVRSFKESQRSRNGDAARNGRLGCPTPQTPAPPA